MIDRMANPERLDRISIASQESGRTEYPIAGLMIGEKRRHVYVMENSVDKSWELSVIISYKDGDYTITRFTNRDKCMVAYHTAVAEAWKAEQ